MKSVRLTGQARQYLRAEAEYLRARNPRAAAGFLERMSEARALLARFPDAGFERTAPPVPGVRRLVAGDYLIDYSVIQNGVVILSIRHGAQNEAPPADPDFDFEV